MKGKLLHDYCTRVQYIKYKPATWSNVKYYRSGHHEDLTWTLPSKYSRAIWALTQHLSKICFIKSA